MNLIYSSLLHILSSAIYRFKNFARSSDDDCIFINWFTNIVGRLELAEL